MTVENKFSVIIPAYNEKATVLEVAHRVLALPEVSQLIIVDDGSTDGTADEIKKLSGEPRVELFFHAKNIGKGAALRTGLGHVKAPIVAFQDADLEYDPQELLELIKPIGSGFADCVYGSRLSGGKPQRVYMFWHKLGNNFLTFVTNMLYNTTLSDMETGYKVFRTDSIKTINLKSRGFEVEPEITAKVFKRKLRVYEIPISYYGRTYQEGKKITWRHGFSALLSLIKYRFMD
jgi:glycosyltransferase involved in cell wall biosynthesis